jgi:opacity protein-like surface antigen
MKRTMTILAAVGMLAMGPTTSEARWRIDAAGGAFIPSTSVEARKGDDETHLGRNAGGSFAMAGGYGLGDWVDLTGRFQGGFTGELFGDSLDTLTLTAGPRVFLTGPQRVRPWLASEIGWYHVGASTSDGFLSTDGSSQDSFGLNVGGGFDVSVHRNVSVGVDVRYQNAFNAFDGIQFVTAMLNVGIHLGGE